MKILGFRIRTDPTLVRGVGPVAIGVNWYEHDVPSSWPHTLDADVLDEGDAVDHDGEEPDVPDDGLTPAERVVSDALLLAFQEFMKLPTQHPDERRDFVDGIHQCQNQLMWRIVRRAHPRAWPIKQEEER